MPQTAPRWPRWLDHGQPAHAFFHQPAAFFHQPAAAAAAHDAFQPSSGRGAESAAAAPSRKIAHRGSEVFYAAGNEIRWADLAALKDAAVGGGVPAGQSVPAGNRPPAGYKTLQTAVPARQPIQHISVSPSGALIAVLTRHTCRVCLLPPPEALAFPDHSTFKLKSFTVGPTAHVVERAPLAGAVWHPLAPSGNALVTVTRDAVVRLWELDPANRAAFDAPTAAVDLRKLARATSAREDVGASPYGAKKGFSVDELDMQVAAACFGGTGQHDEDAWSSMTLWVAMSEGGVYALCPFLPSHFWLAPTALPSVTTRVAAKVRAHQHSADATELDELIAGQQSRWLAELDDQDPQPVPGLGETAVYSRPHKPGSIPRLQGPFTLSPDPDFGDITDIHVVAPKVGQEDLFDDDDDDDFDHLAVDEGLSVGVVCLATNTGRVHVCLNLGGVEAEWLPSSSRARAVYRDSVEGAKHLLVFETVDMAPDNQQGDEAWPTFTASPADRYEVYTTQPTGIYSLSLKPWIHALEDELTAPVVAGEGLDFRIRLILESSTTTVSRLTAEVNEPLNDINAAISILDPSTIGYVTLSSSGKTAIAAELDIPVAAAHPFVPDSHELHSSVIVSEPRAPYQPADVFFQVSQLPCLLEKWRRENATGSADLRGPITFNADTLQKLTKAHQVLGSETHSLGLAAAELFRRCERMVNEMKAHVERVRDLNNRVNSVTGEDEFPEQIPGEPELVRGGRSKIENRLRQRQDKTRELHDRVERLRRKMRGLGSKELSAKERAFADEVERIRQTVLPPPPANTGDGSVADIQPENSTWTSTTHESDDADPSGTVAARIDAVRDVYAQLKRQADAVQEELDEARRGPPTADGHSSRPSTANGTPGPDYRARKMDEVWSLLERETALIEATTWRLERLQAGAHAMVHGHA